MAVPFLTFYRISYLARFKTTRVEQLTAKCENKERGMSRKCDSNFRWHFRHFQHVLRNVKDSYFQIDQNGHLYSISFKYHKELNDKIYGLSKQNKDANWIHMDITLPMLPYDEKNDPDGKYQEKIGDVHVDLTKNFIAIIRRNG